MRLAWPRNGPSLSSGPVSPTAAPSWTEAAPSPAPRSHGLASVRLAHHTHSPLVPGTQAAARSHCWKWPPHRCAFHLFPGQRPPCPEEAASQAGGPKIALCVRPGMGLSITARPLPPDASLWWLALIGPLDVETGKPALSPRGMAPQRADCNHMEVRPSALGPGSASALPSRL